MSADTYVYYHFYQWGKLDKRKKKSYSLDTTITVHFDSLSNVLVLKRYLNENGFIHFYAWQVKNLIYKFE